MQVFAEGLMEAYVAASTPGQGSGADGEAAVALSAASVELLRAQPLLADHIVALGYVDALLKLLNSRLPPISPGMPLELAWLTVRRLAQALGQACCAELLLGITLSGSRKAHSYRLAGWLIGQ